MHYLTHLVFVVLIHAISEKNILIFGEFALRLMTRLTT